jgi:hypothetical protein
LLTLLCSAMLWQYMANEAADVACRRVCVSCGCVGGGGGNVARQLQPVVDDKRITTSTAGYAKNCGVHPQPPPPRHHTNNPDPPPTTTTTPHTQARPCCHCTNASRMCAVKPTIIQSQQLKRIRLLLCWRRRRATSIRSGA